MFDFRKLIVWQEGHQLTLAVYQATRPFPKEELFGLTSQMRRSAASIPHNIAEGCGRNSYAELARFVTISMGSASELETQLLLAKDLLYLSAPEAEVLTQHCSRLRRMLQAFQTKIKQYADR
ncbi:four helix bundle protein [Hymenobacter guriensis]|uniref:Four helix bundle protein n=1 Tax=Hymenobacter guriensis TaxID=2793065 RepID=A0ABS0L0E2_9BACT|nr:four helix bundle protein [Hymenobacter guriensis]MBG8553582.1 four helix bundle protein [Hymenobacter guriensis]